MAGGRPLVMASREHSCTRRAVLGAAALPVLACPSGAAGAAAPAEKWQGALAGFRRAEAAMQGFDQASRDVPGRSCEAQDALDEAFSDHVVACNAALRRLLSVPAPDLAALALKVELAIDHEIAPLGGGERWLAILKQDARRLCLS